MPWRTLSRDDVHTQTTSRARPSSSPPSRGCRRMGRPGRGVSIWSALGAPAHAALSMSTARLAVNADLAWQQFFVMDRGVCVHEMRSISACFVCTLESCTSALSPPPDAGQSTPHPSFRALAAVLVACENKGGNKEAGASVSDVSFRSQPVAVAPVLAPSTHALVLLLVLAE